MAEWLMPTCSPVHAGPGRPQRHVSSPRLSIAKTVSPTVRPAGECSSCTSITDGNSLDVLELDAASHNSVDDIRDIKLSVTTVASAADSKRVFVLDEAHMLSKAAGNALLKNARGTTGARSFRPRHHRAIQAAGHDPLSHATFRFSPCPDRGASRVSRDNRRSGELQDRSGRTARHCPPCRWVGSRLSLTAGAGCRPGRWQGGCVGRAPCPRSGRFGGVRSDCRGHRIPGRPAGLGSWWPSCRRPVSTCGGSCPSVLGFFRGVFLAHYAPNLAEIADEPPEVYESWKKAAELIPANDVLRGGGLAVGGTGSAPGGS